MSELLKKSILEQKYKLFFILLFQLIYACLSVLIPYIIGKFIDNLVEYKEILYLMDFFIQFVSILIVFFIIAYLNTLLALNTKNKLILNLNTNIIEHLYNSKYSQLKSLDSGYLTQQITSDVGTLVEFVFNSVINIVKNIFTLLVIFCLIFSINTTIGLLFLFSVPCNIFIYTLFKDKIYKQRYKVSESSSKLYSILNESLSNIWFVKSFSLSKNMINRYNNYYNENFKETAKSTKLDFFFGLTQETVGRSFSLLYFMYGGYCVINNTLSIGKFTILNNYFGNIEGSVSSIINISTMYQQFKVSMDRLNKLMNIELDNDGNIIVNKINSIKVENLNHSYDGRELYNKFNIVLKSGKIYGLHGNNGSGKSTLINLLINLEQPDNGSILINNIDIKTIDTNYLRKNKITLIEQNPVIFNESIDYNLNLFENINAQSDLIFSNTKFMLSNTPVDSLSGGEKKKISITRSLLKETDLIVLDEPESSLDEPSIKELISFLKDKCSDKIIIIITHSEYFKDIIDEPIQINSNIGLATE